MKRDRPSTASKRPAREMLFGLFLLASAGLAMTGGSAQDARSGGGNWDSESGLGNHRAVVRVNPLPVPWAPGSMRSAARAVIPWRRRDAEPDKLNIIVIDAASGERVSNVLPLAVDRGIGDIVFEPKTVPGDYFIYYMPSNPRAGRTIRA